MALDDWRERVDFKFVSVHFVKLSSMTLYIISSRRCKGQENHGLGEEPYHSSEASGQKEGAQAKQQNLLKFLETRPSFLLSFSIMLSLRSLSSCLA